MGVNDFIIDNRKCEEASFDYYLDELIIIKSITLKSILFYNSWFLLPNSDPFLFTKIIETKVSKSPINMIEWFKDTSRYRYATKGMEQQI
jgi:hypothetical protein